MAAILGADVPTVEAVVAEAAADGVCELANDNGEGQQVISGSAAAGSANALPQVSNCSLS